MTSALLPEAYVEIKVEVPNALVDAFCDLIIENLATGIVLEEEEGAPVTGVIFYLPEDAPDCCSPINDFFARVGAEAGFETPVIRRRRVETTAWLEKYRESIELLRIADDLIVRPAWIEPTHDKYQLVVEPRMAFGTGSHATTRSCLKIIRREFEPGMRFLDMGCGSGILSILADQLEASFIKAVDYDLAAVANCRENFDINRLRTPFEVVAGSVERCERDEPYEFVCANIILSTILTMLGRLLRLTAAGGRLVLSGLLDKDEAEISFALRENGQDDFLIVHDEGWLTYTVRKK